MACSSCSGVLQKVQAYIFFVLHSAQYLALRAFVSNCFLQIEHSNTRISFLSTSSFRYNPLVRVGEWASFSGLDGRLSQDAYRIVENWLETVKTGDPEKVANLYAERGVLLGTVARNVKQGRSVIKTYFDTFLKKRPVGFLNSIIFQELGSGHVAADGNYTFEMDGEGGRIRVPARFTFVVDLNTGLILTHHSSSTPGGETTPI